MSETSDADYFFKTLPGKVIRSKRFTDRPTDRDMRIASEVIETPEEVMFTTDLSEITIRQTPTGRQQVKATFFEDDRKIKTLTIQRYRKQAIAYFPDRREHFSFVGAEITRLKKFLASIETMSFEDDEKSQISDQDLDNLILGSVQAQRLIDKNADVFVQLMENESWEKDIVALGYRRKQLELFDRLLTDEKFFQTYSADGNFTPEQAWQDFFEKNHWIFGYGLSYQFLSSLTDRKLEQIVRGFAVGMPGKRTDALMKTRGALGALCLVEIKCHNTDLLKPNPYRSGAWSPTKDVIGGISQLQSTVRAAQQVFGDQLRPVDKDGNPSGELLSVVSPKSFLVVGRLSEFETESGPNMQKFSCFEDFRKNIVRPEIVTFDELYERASYIVEHSQ